MSSALDKHFPKDTLLILIKNNDNFVYIKITSGYQKTLQREK